MTAPGSPRARIFACAQSEPRPPTSPEGLALAAGFYWRRPTGGRTGEVVRIVEVRGALHVLVCGTEGSAPLEETGARYSWHGPLVQP